MAESRAKYGSNVLTEKEQTSLWVKFFQKFNDPLIRILLVAAILSIGISFYEYISLDEGPSVFLEPVGIVVAILLATGLAFLFEAKAEKEFSLLNLVNDEQLVQVIRDGRVGEIPRREVVVGDIVVLNTGDEIPADGLLLQSTNLQVDESSLTGEPLCHKTTEPSQFDTQATFPSNRVLRGTTVIEGGAYMQVDAVGDQTENGKVFTSVQIDNSVRTPLDLQLGRLSRWISRISFTLALIIVVVKILVYSAPDDTESGFIYFLAYVLKALMIAVTLIVVAVPEGLPMAVTLSLAYNMRRMLKTHNLVRRLHACETMGAVNVICTDKTGTLTCNQMRVADTLWMDASHDLPRIVEGIVLNSTAHVTDDKPDERAERTVIGNPTEGALLLWAQDLQADCMKLRRQVEVLDVQPFSTETKMMTTTVRSSLDDRVVTYLKGAPEIVLARCEADAATRAAVEHQLVAWQQRAMRTLALAVAEEAGTFRLLGIVAISDPVRHEVPEAIRQCRAAGIDVIIITGDNQTTACEIGRQIGVDADHIIARARPADKKEKVKALQKEGQVVAVTGDGTNDAPALKAAHVGLSMGNGTAVAKEASDITILDNSFASIVNAVMWGRSLYRNIQRFILFQMTVNIVACLTVLVGAFLGTENPLNVTQMLWVNLIMDTFAAMALSSLPPNPDVMNEPPRRRRAFIIDRPMLRNMLVVGLSFTAILLALLWFMKRHELHDFDALMHYGDYVRPHARLSTYELTFFFTTFVMLQFWNLFSVRRFVSRETFRQLLQGRGFWLIAAIILVGQILMVTFGHAMLGTVPLSLADWFLISVATFLINGLINLFL